MSEWRPILVGAAAADVRDKIFEIGSVLLPFVERGRWPGEAAEAALLFHYLAQSFPDGGYNDSAQALLDIALEEVERRPLKADLHGGLMGVAWAAQHIRDQEEDDDGDFNVAVDDLLLKSLSRPTWRGSFDVI